MKTIDPPADGYARITAPGAVRIERRLPGPIERVWAYLTEPARRATWFAGGDMELREGGAVELVFHNSRLTPGDDAPPPRHAAQGGEVRAHGRVTACDPPRLLAYTWGEDWGDESEVRFELSPRGDEVLLVVTHVRLRDRDAVVSVSGGWHAHLDILAARLAGAVPPAFWRSHTRLEAEYERRIPPEAALGR